MTIILITEILHVGQVQGESVGYNAFLRSPPKRDTIPIVGPEHLPKDKGHSVLGRVNKIR